MTEKLSYEDFKNNYLAKISQETICELEKLHNIKDLQEIIEQDALEQYHKYAKIEKK